MFMQKIRRATKKNRGVLMVIIGILIVGLVSSVAFMGGAPGVQQEGMTLEEWIAAFEDFTAGLDTEGLDFGGAWANADHFMELSGLYWHMFELTGMMEPEWHEKSIAAAGQAEELYAQAYAQIPADLNDDARMGFLFNYASSREAQGNYAGALEKLLQAEEVQPLNGALQAMIATMYAQEGNMLEAMVRFISARDLDPDNMQIVDAYATFLFTFMEPRLAVREWEEYLEHIGAGHPNYEAATGRRDYFSFLAAFLAPLPELDLDDDEDDE